jgi:hypothetical protein
MGCNRSSLDARRCTVRGIDLPKTRNRETFVAIRKAMAVAPGEPQPPRDLRA